MKRSILIICSALACTGNAHSQSIITFDDISAVGFGPHSATGIPNNYMDFNWINLAVFNATSFPQSGILNGIVSGPNVAVSPGSVPSSSPVISTISASSPFILVSGYFTSAFLNGMPLEVTGINANTTVFDETYTLNVTGPSYLTFPADAITEVDFAPSGGSLPGPDYLGGGSEMVLDNLTVEAAPEPSIWTLIGSGASLLGLFRQKRRK